MLTERIGEQLLFGNELGSKEAAFVEDLRNVILKRLLEIEWRSMSVEGNQSRHSQQGRTLNDQFERIEIASREMK